MRYLLILMASATLFTSCQNFFSQTLEADPPQFNESLVFHQFIGKTDTSIRLILTRNFGVFDAVDDYSKWYIKGATVEWWHAGQKVINLTPLSTDSAFVYTGQFPVPLLEGEQYEIRVSHPDFKTVTVSQILPKQIDPPTSIDFKRNLAKDEYGQYQHELSFIIKDDPNVDNYYEFLVSGEFTVFEYIGVDPQGNIIFDTLQFEANTPVSNTFDPNIADGFGNSLLLSDQFFNGQDYKFVGRIYSNYGSSEGDSTKYSFTVRSISPDYYKWSVSANRQENNQSNPFAEPVSIFNNLENGLGIFGMYTERKTKVE